MQNTLFSGSSYKMPKAKKIFFGQYKYFIYRYWAFFKLEAFNCKVSFHRLTLTTVIVILHLKFEVKVNLKRLAIRNLSRLLNN